MIRKLKPHNIYIINGTPLHGAIVATDKDSVRIGYRGIGEGDVPNKVMPILQAVQFVNGAVDTNTLINVLKLCVEESQVVKFEEVA
jgi:hypothetical protein